MSARRFVALLTAGLVVLGSPGPVAAGPPKAQTVNSVHIDRHHRVHAEVFADGRGIDTKLAQVRMTLRVRIGKACRTRSGSALAMRVARDLHLNKSVRLAPEGRAIYLHQPEDGGPYSSARNSYNLALVRRGLATVSRSRGAYKARFLSAQRVAKRRDRGIWRCR